MPRGGKRYRSGPQPGYKKRRRGLPAAPPPASPEEKAALAIAIERLERGDLEGAAKLGLRAMRIARDSRKRKMGPRRPREKVEQGDLFAADLAPAKIEEPGS